MIKTTIRQTRGPKLVFTGRRIAETAHDPGPRTPLVAVRDLGDGWRCLHRLAGRGSAREEP